MRPVLPNFFLVGAVKSGSTSLYYYLDQHPQIFMSPVKEPHYFSSFDLDYASFRPLIKKRVASFDLQAYLDSPMNYKVHRAYIKSWNDYLKLFKNVKNEIALGEASTSYLWSASAAKKIKEKIPDAKIILMLRNPVDRAFSHYLMDLKNDLVSVDFTEAFENDLRVQNPSWGKNAMYAESGIYTRQVKRYLDEFPQKNILIVLSDDLKSNASQMLGLIYRFIGVDESFAPDFSKKYNTTSLPLFPLAGKIYNNIFMRKYFIDKLGDGIKAPFRHWFLKSKGLPVLKEADKDRLHAIFAKDIVSLQKLIDRDLSHWLK